MKRYAVLLYGGITYTLFLLTFLYLIGFVGNLFVPKGIDGDLTVPIWQAIAVNLGLIVLFAAQHKYHAPFLVQNWWTQLVPEAMERSTYVLFTCIALIIMFFYWLPMGGMVWSIEGPIATPILMVLFFTGWGLVLLSSFLINHFDLFGLRQVWLYFQRKPYSELKFRVPFLYKSVRHPLYMGLLLAFWATPTMSMTRLFFATFFTIYVLRAIRWEESDLIKSLGEQYRAYSQSVPMIIPNPFKKKHKASPYQTIMKSKEAIK